MNAAEELVSRFNDLEHDHKIMREALEFYSKARVLFCSFDGSMPVVGPEGLSKSTLDIQSEVHAMINPIKDDGQNARRALSKLKVK